jgi:hypothetical protein
VIKADDLQPLRKKRFSITTNSYYACELPETEPECESKAQQRSTLFPSSLGPNPSASRNSTLFSSPRLSNIPCASRGTQSRLLELALLTCITQTSASPSIVLSGNRFNLESSGLVYSLLTPFFLNSSLTIFPTLSNYSPNPFS